MQITKNLIITCEKNMSMYSRYPDLYFDLASEDPPYFSGPEKRRYYGNKINKLNIKRIDYPVTEKWYIPDLAWFSELKRVSKNQIIWGANYFDFIGKPFKTPRGEEIHQFIKDNPIGWIIWDKCNGSSIFNDYELAWTSFDIPTRIYKFLWNGMMQGKSINEGWVMQGDKSLNQKKIHPTEKPIMLYQWIFREYTKSGFKVCSGHTGSGSDALASLDFDIEFIGCDAEIQHVENSIARIIKKLKQQKLF